MHPHLDNLRLYESDSAALRWLRLAHAHSPMRESSERLPPLLSEAAAYIYSRASHADLIALACGDAHKEIGIALCADEAGSSIGRIVLIDASEPLLARARDHAIAHTRSEVSALSTTLDRLRQDVLDETGGPPVNGPRIFTLFGAIGVLGGNPVAVASNVMRSGDLLIATAYTLPDDVEAAEHVVATYDNKETREWIAACLQERGLLADDYALSFVWRSPFEGIVGEVAGVATACRPCILMNGDKAIHLKRGDRVDVLRSARHDESSFRAMLTASGLEVLRHATSADGMEGLCVARK